MQIDVRMASKKDLDSLTELVSPSYGRTLDDELEDQDRGILSFVIAWVDSKACGYGFVRWDGARSKYVRSKCPRLPEVYRLTVLENMQSNGIGTRLMQYIESKAVTRGINVMGLGVSYANVRAYELYKRIGYRDVVAKYYDVYNHVDKKGVVHEVKEKCRYMCKQIHA